MKWLLIYLICNGIFNPLTIALLTGEDITSLDKVWERIAAFLLIILFGFPICLWYLTDEVIIPLVKSSLKFIKNTYSRNILPYFPEKSPEEEYEDFRKEASKFYKRVNRD